MQLDTSTFKYVRSAEIDDTTGLMTLTVTITPLDTLSAVVSELDESAMALLHAVKWAENHP